MKNWYNITVVEENNEAEIFIFEEIGFWGVTAAQFIRDFKAIKKDVINIHINSPGGEVFAGTAIYNAIRTSKKKVNIFIDGLAASMASVIAMAGDTVTMADNAFIMIHNPMAAIWGSAEELEKEIDVLNKIKDQLITAYENKTGMDREKLSKMMDDETWIESGEAEKMGFVDEVIKGKKIAAFFDVEGRGFKNGKKYDLKKNLEKSQNFHAKSKNDDKIHASVFNNNSAGQPENNTSEEIMDLNELKEKHPDIYKEAINQGKAEGYAEGTTEGAQAEAKRINEIHALNITGHDEIINKALEDGKSTAADVTLAVHNAQQKANELELQARKDESKEEVDKVEAGAAPEQKDQDLNNEKINKEAKEMAAIVNAQYEDDNK